MLRNILAVIVAYVAMFIVVAVFMSLAWVLMGAEGAFKDASWDVSMGWIVVSTIISIGAAIIGGVVCGMVSRRSAAARNGLIGLVIVLGVLTAVMQFGSEGPEDPRPEGVSMTEGASNIRQPGWVMVVNPIIAVCGVAVGFSAVRGKHPTPAPEGGAEG
jgi:hypothetical protein